MFKKGIEIFYKVRRHGIIASFRIVMKMVIQPIYFFCKHKLPWPLRARFYYHLTRLIFAPNYTKKRILGIWDFKALPLSIGDPLTFIELLSVLKIKYNAEEIDICVVYDRENPGGNRAKEGINNNITVDNGQDYMLEFLPLFSTCPYLGTVYQFNSRREFHRFLKNNLWRYNIFPPLGQHLGESYNFHGGAPAWTLKEIEESSIRNGHIPYLRIGDRDKAWAQWFYVNHMPEKTAYVTLSLKQTSHSQERNINPDTWSSFIDKCKAEFPEVVFVVVGLREEIFAGLRERSNVIVAKDFGTSIIEDLALIRTSLMYIGTNSGVNNIAIFSSQPYLIFQMPVSVFNKYSLESGKSFRFATNKQKIFSTKTAVTTEFLFDEFKELYSKLATKKWHSEVLKNARNKHGHPTARAKE